jgi:hypothetical protein
MVTRMVKSSALVTNLKELAATNETQWRQAARKFKIDKKW